MENFSSDQVSLSTNTESGSGVASPQGRGMRRSWWEIWFQSCKLVLAKHHFVTPICMRRHQVVSLWLMHVYFLLVLMCSPASPASYGVSKSWEWSRGSLFLVLPCELAHSGSWWSSTVPGNTGVDRVLSCCHWDWGPWGSSPLRNSYIFGKLKMRLKLLRCIWMGHWYFLKDAMADHFALSRMDNNYHTIRG